MGMRKFTATEAQDLCEIIEERSINKSIAFTTQLPVDHWNEVIPDTVIFDAIRDRLEHSALTINTLPATPARCQSPKTCLKEKGRVELSYRGSADDPCKVDSLYPKPRRVRLHEKSWPHRSARKEQLIGTGLLKHTISCLRIIGLSGFLNSIQTATQSRK